MTDLKRLPESDKDIAVTLCKTVELEAAHHIPNHPGKCKRPHGHSYKIEVYVRGPVDPETGMIRDFYEISDNVKRVIVDHCDHQDLNQLYPDMLTTAENLARRWLRELLVLDYRFWKVRVWETRTGSAEAEFLNGHR